MSALPPEAAERLGPYYVYALVDPARERIFYVGKGTGQRLLAHGREADLTVDEPRRSEKLRRIRELRAAGLEPQLDVVRHGLSEQQALEVEAALIDCLPDLVNVATGHGVSHGRDRLSEYVARYGATPVPDGAPPAVLIRLRRWQEQHEEIEPGTWRAGNGYRPGMPTSELVEATRAWWKMSPTTIERRGIEHAVAVHDGVTRAVMRIGGWTQRNDGRWAFTAKPVEEGPAFDTWIGDVGRRIAFVAAAQNPIYYWPPTTP